MASGGLVNTSNRGQQQSTTPTVLAPALRTHRVGHEALVSKPCARASVDGRNVNETTCGSSSGQMGLRYYTCKHLFGKGW